MGEHATHQKEGDVTITAATITFILWLCNKSLVGWSYYRDHNVLVWRELDGSSSYITYDGLMQNKEE